MKNRRFLARWIAILVIISMFFAGCGPKKQPNETTGIVPTVDSSNMSSCETVLKEYAATASLSDGLIVYSEGNYYVVIGNELYAGQNIQPLTYEGAGETVLPDVATFREIPYVANGETAKACNYSLEATADGKAYTVSFYLDGTVEQPKFITLYEKDGVQITAGTVGQVVAAPAAESPVKNIIFMIADGGGYDNFTLANKVKEEMTERGTDKLAGAKTQVTNNLLESLGKPSTKGLYLNELLVGSANTLIPTPHHGIAYTTDSSAAGTALATGYKTIYCYAGIDSDRAPKASISELARMNGMSTGVITTKSYLDATPLAFITGHSINRSQNIDHSIQALLSNIDVVIGEGTEFGDLRAIGKSTHPDLSASTMGYSVARNKSQLLEQAATATRLWAPILGVDNVQKKIKTRERDSTSSHISYDVDAAISSEQPSLLDMTKAALQVLGTNINNPEGFFLMIEGGALDNAAEGSFLRPTVGEYLAFDEAFGYCVDWAAKRGDTIVIAVPDHDSGGFSGIEKCADELINSIITGKIGDQEFHSQLGFEEIKTALANIGADSKEMKFEDGHTDMPVPISLYAPDSIRETLLKNMTLPTTAGNVRTGTKEYYVPNESGTKTWYASSALNADYLIENTKIAPALVKTLNLGSLEDATNILFQKVGSTESMGAYGGKLTVDPAAVENYYGKYNRVNYATGALSVDRNATQFKLDGTQQDIPKIGNQQPMPVFIQAAEKQTTVGDFYVPCSVLTSAKLGWSITISCEDFGFGKVLFAKGTDSITLPDAPEGKEIIYTDGVNVYHAGDVIPHSGSNLELKAYTK